MSRRRVSIVELKRSSGFWVVERTEHGPVRLRYQNQPLLLDADQLQPSAAVQAAIDRILR